MRPVKLTISAFGPYADKQVIDFEELKGRNIFVISGKTGSGKTTIFDAISYALYGEASGESRETDSLRSHFADDDIETFVELEFDLRGERYVVNRVPKQKKKKARGEGYTEKSADATLTLPDGKVITKVKAVTDKLESTLGITREQFKQIVMLPQGEFKKLLLAKSEDREVIFRKIFNTYDFEKIQMELKERAQKLSKNRSKSKDKIQNNLENIEGEHNIVLGEYVDFPLVIEKLKELIERDTEKYGLLEKEDKDLYAKLQEKDKEKIIFKNNNDLLKEKEDIIKAYEELLGKEDEFKGKEKTLTNAKNAKEVKYIEDKLVEYKKRLDIRNIDYKNSIYSIAKLKDELKVASGKLSVEENKESERDNLKIEIKRLIGIEPKILEFDNLNNEVLKVNIQIDKIKLDINSKKILIENLKKEKIEKENNLKEIATLETKKVTLENEIENKTKLIDETRALFKSISDYEKDMKNHFKLSEEYKSFEKEYISVKNSYEIMDELYKKEQAGILASQLESNKPCPVCGSTSHPSPATLRSDVKVPTKEELKIAKEKLDESEKENKKKINDLTALNSKIKTSLESVNNNLEKLSNALNIESKYYQGILDVVKYKGGELSNTIKNLSTELDKLKEKIKLKESINKNILEIDKNTSLTEKELESLEVNEKQYIKDSTELNTKIETYKKEIPQDINSVKVLKELIDIKKNELDNSIKVLEKLREEKDRVSKRLEGENSTSKEIGKSIEELNKDINNITLEFDTSMKKQGFNDVNSYEEAKSMIGRIESLESEVKKFYEDLKVLKSKKEDILVKTEDLQIVDLATITEEINNIKNLKIDLEKNLRELYSILVGNKTVLKNVESLNIEFKEIEEEYKVVGELADLANGKKYPYISFERYILASYFEEIIDAANIRLEKMTGDRFSLIRKRNKSKGAGQKGLELEIYDNYTDSSRDVSSLSGGESFKASLSLALGLSDVVQSSAGGVSLDTMFVDEGFGTLDPQSLDNAIDSLLELQRGGRLVGIISHVEELKERIDAKLEVVSTQKGSKAEFSIL